MSARIFDRSPDSPTSQIMASKTLSSSTCEMCSRRLPQSTRTHRVACEICRASISSTTSLKTGSQPSSSVNSIPSTYLDLLDSKIAEYEHAAERSSSNSRSTDTDNSATKVAKAARSNNLSPYIQESHRSPPRKTSPPGSVVMTRFLNDPTEPDGVRDAILASRLLKSR